MQLFCIAEDSFNLREICVQVCTSPAICKSEFCVGPKIHLLIILEIMKSQTQPSTFLRKKSMTLKIQFWNFSCAGDKLIYILDARI